MLGAVVLDHGRLALVGVGEGRVGAVPVLPAFAVACDAEMVRLGLRVADVAGCGSDDVAGLTAAGVGGCSVRVRSLC